jgi:hypothetical protein
MKVLLFSPHAYFSMHALPEALVAQSLIDQGVEVITVNCDGIYSNQCLCMPLTRTLEEKEKKSICKNCKKNRDTINKEFGFRSELIENFVTSEDRLQAEKLVNSLKIESYLDLLVKNIPIAQFALYEFLLNHKLPDTIMPKRLWGQYKSILMNTLLTMSAIEKLIEKERPSRITTYNSTYSVNRIVCAISEDKNISHFEILSGNGYSNRYQKIMINKGIGKWLLYNKNPFLMEKRKIILTQKEIKDVTANFVTQFKALSPWVYSIASKRISSHRIRSMLGISLKQKILLATMSSADEVVGLRLAGVTTYEKASFFKTQQEWVEWLIKFARYNENYFIVIRVHPREFPNKRDQILSENANRFMKFVGLLDKPKNVFINTPSDNLSLYDLLKITDVLLNRSSTAAVEASLYGIPVVGVGDRLFLSDPILQSESYCEEEYAISIKNAADSGWNFENVIHVYRWMNYLSSEVEIDISDGYSNYSPILSRAINKILRIVHKLGFVVSELTPIWQVTGRKNPLKNTHLLTYAIVNDKDDHIGVFKQDCSVLDALTERTQIKLQYKKLMAIIATEEDKEFLERIEYCAN